MVQGYKQRQGPWVMVTSVANVANVGRQEQRRNVVGGMCNVVVVSGVTACGYRESNRNGNVGERS